MTDENLANIVQAGILKKAREEAADLKPTFDILDGGQYSPNAKLTMGNVCPIVSQAQHEEAQVRAAAGYVFDWLAQDKSCLRGILHILSLGGAFYSGAACDKTIRAAVDSTGGQVAKDDFVKGAIARHSGRIDASDSALRQGTSDVDFNI